MSIQKFIDKYKGIAEIGEFFKNNSEFTSYLFKETEVNYKKFAALPEFQEICKILRKYEIYNEFEDALLDQLHLNGRTRSLRLIGHIFGHPFHLKEVPFHLKEVEGLVKELLDTTECDKKGSCGDCECDESGEKIEVVLTPDGDLAYGVSDEPLTLEEEIKFLDNIRSNDEVLSAVKKDKGGSQVDHPKHYNAHPSKVECIELAEKMSFNLGNAFKYVFRRDDKENTFQDLSKADWYLTREIGRLEQVLDSTPIGRVSAIHPDLSGGDMKKVHRIVTTEPNKDAAEFYDFLFEPVLLRGYEDLDSLRKAQKALQRLMDAVRREQDAAREGLNS